MLTRVYRAASIGPRAASRWRSSVFAFSLLVGVAGCATAKVPTPAAPARAPRVATLEEVLAAYEGYCKSIETLSASGDLDVRDLRGGKTQKLAVRLVAARGGRLYLKGSVTVVTALEIVSTGERFWFQVPSKKTVWTGEAGAAPRRDSDRPAYESLRPRDLTTALMPEPLAPDPDGALILEAELQAFSVSLARMDGTKGVLRRRVWVTRESLTPVRAREYDERGELVSEVSLSGWRDGFPRTVSLVRPGDGYEASFVFSKVERNVAVTERAFQPRPIPEGYKAVEVGN